MQENTIMLQGERNVYEEANTSVAVLPGHIVEMGAAGTVKPETRTGITASPVLRVAIEEALLGEAQITEYAIGALCRFQIPKRGHRYKLRASGAATFTKGLLVKSAGGGQIATFTPDGTNGVVIGEVEETVTTTAADQFVKIRIG